MQPWSGGLSRGRWSSCVGRSRRPCTAGPQAAEKARGACRPGRDTAVRRKSFLPYFLYFTKSRKKLLGRAKSCQWQVFVRRRPPKQGELRTDVSKATMFQGDDSVLRPRFKALPEILLEKLSNGTCRNRFFAQNGGEKALNRCEVPALQREDLERTAKEWPCSSQTVGYGWVRICGVSCRKGLLFEGNMEGLV